MSKQIQVRKLTEPDAQAWAAIRLKALRDHPLAFGSSVPDTIQPLIDRFLETVSSPESSVIFGAFQKDRLVGTTGINRNPGLKERHKAFIWGVYVAPEARRSGIAEQLLRSAIQHARDWLGVEVIQLTVSEFALEAMRLYDKLGFEAWGIEPRALCFEGRYADEVHMVLRLR